MNILIVRLMAAFSFIYASPYFQRSENKSLDATTTKITLKKDNTGDFSPQNLFKLADAEKILGEKAHLKDSTSKEEIQQFQFKSTFTVDTKEAATQEIGNVYFMLEDYNQEGDAQKKYNEFKNANQNFAGFNLLKNLGDDAFFHTDSHNFYLIIVRKDKKMIRIKVNKVTEKTSLEALNETAKSITATL